MSRVIPDAGLTLLREHFDVTVWPHDRPPTREELIASSSTPEEICKYIGADSLGYVSLAGLKKAIGDTEADYCTSCYTGVYPTDLVQLQVRENHHTNRANEPKNGSENLVEHSVAVEHEG